MKILKKIGIGCLALIICLCSCFKSVDAYSFTNFVVPYTVAGSTYMQPLVNCNLSFVNNDTYLVYPLTPYNYVGASNQSQEVNSYYDLEFNKHYSFILDHNVRSETIWRNIGSESQSIVYSYQVGQTNFYNIDYSERNISEIVIDYDFNLLYFRDVSYFDTYLYLSSDLNTSGNYSIEIYFEYFENGQLSTSTFTFDKQIDTSTENFIYISPWSFFGKDNQSYDALITNVQPMRIRSKITSEDINLNLVNHIQFETRYVNVVQYANIFGLVSKSSTIVVEPPSDDIDFTNWLTNSVNSFMNLEIFPNFKLGSILGVIVSIPLLIYILKLFLGG